MIENGFFDIENCIFESNSAETDSQFENWFSKTKSNDVIDFVRGRGGGMNIYFRGETHHVKLQTHKNRALYVQLSFSGSSYDLKIQASQSYFWNNMAQIKGRAVGAGFIINGLQIQYCYQNVIFADRVA